MVMAEAACRAIELEGSAFKVSSTLAVPLPAMLKSASEVATPGLSILMPSRPSSQSVIVSAPKPPEAAVPTYRK